MKLEKIFRGMIGNKLVTDTIDHVLPPPKWFVDKLEKLKKLTPPSLAEIDEQMKASAALRKKFVG